MITHRLLRLRRAPKHVRDRCALIGAVAVTGFVAFVWAVSVPGRVATDQAALVATKDEPAPFSSLFSGIRDQFASVIQSATGATSSPEANATTTVSVAADAIVLTSDEVSAANAQVEGYVPAATTTGQVVHIITTSELASTSGEAALP